MDQTSPGNGPVPRLALRPGECAIALGVSEDHFRAHISPELAWVRRGRVRVVALSELQRFLDDSAERAVEGR